MMRSASAISAGFRASVAASAFSGVVPAFCWKCSMKSVSGFFSASVRLSNSRFRQMSRSAAPIFVSGRMLPASTMAASRPARTASCRKTEFKIFRAAGERPNEMLLRPSTQPTPGSAALMSRMPASVWSALSRRVSSPAPMVKVSASNSRSCGRSPNSPQAMAWICRAVATFSSAFIAMPPL